MSRQQTTADSSRQQQTAADSRQKLTACLAASDPAQQALDQTTYGGEGPPSTGWRWLYIGEAGTGSFTHTDPLDSAAWLCCIKGRKAWRAVHAADFELVRSLASGVCYPYRARSLTQRRQPNLMCCFQRRRSDPGSFTCLDSICVSAVLLTISVPMSLAPSLCLWLSHHLYAYGSRTTSVPMALAPLLCLWLSHHLCAYGSRTASVPMAGAMCSG